MGLLGNIVIIPVLLSSEHRKKSNSPFMLNMAFVDILLCAFGFTVSVSYNLAVKSESTKDSLRCAWLAFINCFSGINSIATLTVMAAISYTGVTSLRAAQVQRFDSKKTAIIIAGIWIYSFVTTIPPAFGWNRFVPFLDGISCHPDWVSQKPADKAYIGFLVVLGFFLPMIIIVFSYLKTYGYIRHATIPASLSNESVFRRQLETKRKTLRMVVAAILMFFISWSPYCIVSLIESAKGEVVLSPGVSMIPELMAKASVMYNPVVYTLMNARFRATLKRLLHLSPMEETTDLMSMTAGTSTLASQGKVSQTGEECSDGPRVISVVESKERRALFAKVDRG
ncbi:melanopsin isoform X2 [Nematostella vectensis]|nr:melanopsin isoform X2 [Nematostella vectensis]